MKFLFWKKVLYLEKKNNKNLYISQNTPIFLELNKNINWAELHTFKKDDKYFEDKPGTFVKSSNWK